MGLRNKGDSGSLSVANNLHKINTSDWRRGSANHIHKDANKTALPPKVDRGNSAVETVGVGSTNTYIST